MTYIIDRFEETADGTQTAVLEDPKTGQTHCVPRLDLPKGVKPGQALCYANGRYAIDTAETEARIARIRAKMERLRK